MIFAGRQSCGSVSGYFHWIRIYFFRPDNHDPDPGSVHSRSVWTRIRTIWTRIRSVWTRIRTVWTRIRNSARQDPGVNHTSLSARTKDQTHLSNSSMFTNSNLFMSISYKTSHSLSFALCFSFYLFLLLL